MRTTISLDDRIAKVAQRRAHQEGLSFSALVSRALQQFIAGPPTQSESTPFRLITAGRGGTHPGVDLDRSSELLVAEDEAEYRNKRGKH